MLYSGHEMVWMGFTLRVDDFSHRTLYLRASCSINIYRLRALRLFDVYTAHKGIEN